jgi:hypothetical protein
MTTLRNGYNNTGGSGLSAIPASKTGDRGGLPWVRLFILNALACPWKRPSPPLVAAWWHITAREPLI